MTFVWPPKCPDCGTDLGDECGEVAPLDDVQCPNCRRWLVLDWDYNSIDGDCNEYWFVVGVGETYERRD